MPPIIPFPNEVPVDNGENGASNEAVDNFLSDSDTLSEDEDHDGYEPLSQDPDNCNENHSDLEEDNNFLHEDDSLACGVNLVNQHSLLLPAPPTESFAADQQKNPKEVLKMDADKIETIKSVMKSITLPTSNLPQWASVVPEEEWKTALLTQMLSKEKHSASRFGETSRKSDDSQNEVAR